MSRFLRVVLMILSIGCFTPLANADTVVLDSGETVMGDIIHRTPTQVTLNVEGMPETFFLGEIQSIDGRTIEIPAVAKHEAIILSGPSKSQAKKINAPYYNDEENSLIKYMNILSQQGDASSSSSPKAPMIPVSAAVHKTVPPITTKPPAIIKTDAADASKNIVSTSDGGIIVVGHEKLTKYDKDLNIIREVSLSDSANPS